VGNLLGSGRPLVARMTSWLCVAIGGGFMAACAVVILSAKDVIGNIFTKDTQVGA
jgi:Na+-driven multidrug efflux pump